MSSSKLIFIRVKPEAVKAIREKAKREGKRLPQAATELVLTGSAYEKNLAVK
jgi:hypothetical protein